MKNLPFALPGRFYRGNLHTHSTRSDGERSVEGAVAAYREAGYDFLALTDHFLERYGFPVVDTRPFRTESFTTLLGAELHGPQTEFGGMWHIVAVGLPPDFAPLAPGETGPQVAARAAGAGAFVGIAHPAWYNLTLEDAAKLEAAHAVEVYNETCAQDNDRGESWYFADQLAARGRRLHAYAADDTHFTRRPDLFGGWVQVRAERLDPDALMAALKAGHFYSSQGPEIRTVEVIGGHLFVACSPARAIFVSGRGSASGSMVGDGVTDGTFPIGAFAGSYCRVTVVDAAGKRAWTNPIWLD